MSDVKCPHCGATISSFAKRCKKCGRWVSDEAEQEVRKARKEQSDKQFTQKTDGSSWKERLTFCLQFLVYSLFNYWKAWLALGLIILGLFLWRDCKNGGTIAPRIGVESDSAIAATPEEVREMQDIFQWEFLSVETEELAELFEKGTFGDRRIARIYDGTLRIGIDQSRLADDWFQARGDTAVLTLPTPALLDDDFILETSAEPFYSSGTWGAGAREKLYNQAKERMKQRCLTPENLEQARNNATYQFQKIFNALGYSTVEVNYE